MKKLYKTTGKYEYQHQKKAIIEEATVSTPEGCTDNSAMKPNIYVSNKNPSSRKSLHQFT